MNIIGAFDRETISTLTPDNNSVLILVTNFNTQFPTVNKHWADVLKLKFDDSYETNIHNTPISSKQANQILEFAIQHIDKNIYVSCDVGMSRSPAIVVALEEIFNSNDVSDYYHHYNHYVKNKITEVIK